MRLAINENTKKSVQDSPLGIDMSEVIVDEVHKPVTLHDGTVFYGLYPVLPMPERIFSHDHVSFLNF